MNTTKDVLFAWCVNQTGKPYIWGGNGPDQWDCSGLIQEFYSIIGIDPPGDQTAQGYYNYWYSLIDKEAFHIAKSKLSFGDMLFFGSGRHNITHIAVAMSRHILFEAGGGGHSCKNIDVARSLGAAVRFRPIHLRKDFQIAIRPYYFTEMILNQ